MGAYAEYLQKSNELFRIIGGKFSIGEAQKAALRREFEDLLYETALRDGYPVGTSKDLCDPVSSGYEFAIEECSFEKNGAKAICEKYKMDNIALANTGDHYIGDLLSAKCKRRFAIISNNQESIRAIALMNELFYKTPPVLKGVARSGGQSVRPRDSSPIRTVSYSAQGKATANASAGSDDLPTTSWDTLD